MMLIEPAFNKFFGDFYTKKKVQQNDYISQSLIDEMEINIRLLTSAKSGDIIVDKLWDKGLCAILCICGVKHTSVRERET